MRSVIRGGPENAKAAGEIRLYNLGDAKQDKWSYN